MSRVFKCDRCNNVYEKNQNDLLKKINDPIIPAIDDWSIAYVQFFNKPLDKETVKFNLCDKCITELYNWMFKGKSL